MREKIAGVVLAGGLSRRMGGGDKSLKQLGGRPMLARVIERLAPQVGARLGSGALLLRSLPQEGADAAW